MRADGSEQTPLTDGSAWDWMPAWSQDGSSIAFSSYRNGNPEIYIMNVDGSDQRRLDSIGRKPKLERILQKLNPFKPTNKWGGDGDPAWSPDGARIAFSSNQDGFFNKIYVMNADGSHRTRLTETETSENPVWSPDGNRIAFSSARDGDWQIYVMSADGSSQTRLTNTSSPEGRPDWSPDGTRIAFSSPRDGVSQIYVINADGSDPVNISNSDSDDSSPSWSL